MNQLSSNEILRNNIKYYRITRGFTQEKMSELMEINEKHYCNLENGRYNFTLENLDLVSKILNKQPWELFKERHTEDEVPSRLDFFKNQNK